MNATAPASDLLVTIVAATRRVVETRRAQEPWEGVMRRAEEVAVTSPVRRFRAALQRPDRVNFIAECKRRSPSRGVLRDAYDPAELAAAYARGGAAAISVLTETAFFDGSLEHLRAVRGRVALPLLRKDFIVDEYQVAEARANGADAILLIVAALSDEALKTLDARARALDLDVLVEVHDAAELERALAIGAGLIGVNNRNLRTLAVDTQVSHSLIARMPTSVTAVAESGLTSADEVEALRALGYSAFLVGERLVTSADPEAALRALCRERAGS